MHRLFIIPDLVNSIEANAFRGCSNLGFIHFNSDLNSQLTAIVIDAFAGLPISGFTIPDKVSSIEANAFRDCTNLENIQFGENSQLTTIVRCFC